MPVILQIVAYWVGIVYLLWMQAPRTSRASLVKGRSQANAVAQQALIAHWQSIVKSLNNYLKLMKANYVSFEILSKLKYYFVADIKIKPFRITWKYVS